MKRKTILESVLDRGFTRRDFKMSTALAATMGLDFSETDKVIASMVVQKKDSGITDHFMFVV